MCRSSGWKSACMVWRMAGPVVPRRSCTPAMLTQVWLVTKGKKNKAKIVLSLWRERTCAGSLSQDRVECQGEQHKVPRARGTLCCSPWHSTRSWLKLPAQVLSLQSDNTIFALFFLPFVTSHTWVSIAGVHERRGTTGPAIRHTIQADFQPLLRHI